MRSYQKYCGLARALDILAEEWSLLIVRELLDGPRRPRQLLDQLDGLAENVLMVRLRRLRHEGVVDRQPDGTYALTRWGDDLRETIHALTRWSEPLLARPRGEDEFELAWLRDALIAHVEGVDPDHDDLTVELRCDDDPVVTLRWSDGSVDLTPGVAEAPDLVLEGPTELVVTVLLGQRGLCVGSLDGLEVVGDLSRLSALRPSTRSPLGRTR